MKTKIAFFFLLCTVVLSTSVAQSREDDDMYFTSKDRAAMNAALQKDRQEIFASSKVRRITESETASIINPTDSYSARNVNPEYISGAKVGSNASSTDQYFSPNYQPTAVNQNLSSNCASCGFNNFNNGFYSPFNRFGNPYRMGGMGMMGLGMSPWGYNSMSMMNPWMDPWMMNGFYQPGFSIGFGILMLGQMNEFSNLVLMFRTLCSFARYTHLSQTWDDLLCWSKVVQQSPAMDTNTHDLLHCLHALCNPFKTIGDRIKMLIKWLPIHPQFIAKEYRITIICMFLNGIQISQDDENLMVLCKMMETDRDPLSELDYLAIINVYNTIDLKVQMADKLKPFFTVKL